MRVRGIVLALLLAGGGCAMEPTDVGPPVLPPEILPLWPEMVDGPYQPYLKTYLLDDPAPRGVVVVFPGGGYEFVHEAIDGAVFNHMGLHAVVAFYRVWPGCYPAPQQDAFRAVQLVRANAERWRIRPDRLAVAGISAGGHVAAGTGTLLGDPALVASPVADDVAAQDRRPDAMILCVPVLTGGVHANHSSFDHLLGKDASAERRLAFSLETRVTPATPPTFLWGTAADDVVAIENSLLFASALRRAGVPWELHVFPHGWHGSYDTPDYPPTRAWETLCAAWLRALDFFPAH